MILKMSKNEVKMEEGNNDENSDGDFLSLSLFFSFHCGFENEKMM